MKNVTLPKTRVHRTFAAAIGWFHASEPSKMTLIVLANRS
jgi:hypothetical protein